MARLHEDARDELIGEIVRGRYAEGDLIRLVDVVERFGFSRPVAIEAMRGLEERGMVSTRHGVGASVQPREVWNTLDEAVLTALLASDQAGPVLSEIVECRRILEVEAAALAAERATDAQLAELSAALELLRQRAAEAQESARAEQRFQEAEVAFHRELLLAAGNPALSALTAPIHRALVGALPAPGDRARGDLPERERLVRAIRAGDPDAARSAMREQLRALEVRLRERAG